MRPLLQATRTVPVVLGAFYRDVVRVEQSGEREVTFTMGSHGNQEMPVILGQLRILPKH